MFNIKVFRVAVSANFDGRYKTIKLRHVLIFIDRKVTFIAQGNAILDNKDLRGKSSMQYNL